ncbi:MAG: shikimate kinase AroL [Desulfovermiculus sp.]|nr:shikimate kinase AroL [Desulfovermiculus sp.]
MNRFIQRRFEVEEPEISTTHKRGSGLERKHFDPQSTNIFFIGPRASGKTTLAKAVGEGLGLVCVDTDEMIQEDSGQSVAEIVQEHGWARFRELEHQVLAKVCAGTGQVVATGGGVVLTEENRELLRSSGLVFYLLAEAGVLQERLGKQNDADWRPPLSELDADQEMVSTLAEREPLYFQTLHYLLAAHRPVDELVQDVLERLGYIRGYSSVDGDQ